VVLAVVESGLKVIGWIMNLGLALPGFNPNPSHLSEIIGARKLVSLCPADEQYDNRVITEQRVLGPS